MNKLYHSNSSSETMHATVVEGFRREFGQNVSEEFICCIDKKLSDIFVQKTGIKPGKNACLCCSYAPNYISGVESCYEDKLFINHHWNPVKIMWKSKSGRIYKVTDTDIDCSDIEFWFENFDAELFIKQMYPQVKLPFKLKDLSYELVVTRINLDCSFSLQLKQESIGDSEKIIRQISDFIEDWNIKSEKNDREEGVVHDSMGSFQPPDSVLYEMDMGSAGWSFLKKFLSFLSHMNCFVRVEIM